MALGVWPVHYRTTRDLLVGPLEINNTHIRSMNKTGHQTTYPVDSQCRPVMNREVNHFCTITNRPFLWVVAMAIVSAWLVCQQSCSLTVYPKKYAHGFVVLCFVVVMQSFIMNSHGVFIDIHQVCFAGTGEIVRLPQCQWSKSDGYGKISQCITTTKHNKNRVHISWDIL